MSENEKFYDTSDRKKVDFLKNYSDDPSHPEETKQSAATEPRSLHVKAARYARKVANRHQLLDLTPNQFLTEPDYVEKDIWDLRYASTSDEDDNDE